MTALCSPGRRIGRRLATLTSLQIAKVSNRKADAEQYLESFWPLRGPSVSQMTSARIGCKPLINSNFTSEVALVCEYSGGA
jgi:hypothetical protein